MIKILQVMGRMHRAGMETLVMNIYRNIDREKIQFDFCVHTDEKGEYDDEIISLGGKIFHLPCASVKNVCKLNRSVNDFLKKHNEYKAIHVHYSCVGYFYFINGSKYGIKNLIYHAHNSSREKGLKAYLRYIMEQEAVKYCNIRFACSDLAAKYNFKNKDFIMLNNGIDSEKFSYNLISKKQIREKYGWEEKQICLHIGRFDKQKNHFFLLEAFEKAYRKNNNLILILLGKGPLMDDVRKYSKKLESKNNIMFLGNVDNVNDYLSAADLFLLPSLYEGLPLTVVEAQCSGIRCLISDTITSEATIIPELITRISIDNSIEWANKILSKITYARKDCSQEIVKENFDSKGIAKKVEKYYLSL